MHVSLSLCLSPSCTYTHAGLVNTHRRCTTSHSVVKWVCIHHYLSLWRLLMPDSKHGLETVLNANSVLCNQQTGDNVTSRFVTGTAHRSHECTMTAAQRDTSKSVRADLWRPIQQHVIMGKLHPKRPLRTPCVLRSPPNFILLLLCGLKGGEAWNPKKHQ